MTRHKETWAPAGYVTTTEAARILGRSAQTIRNMIKDGRLQGAQQTDEDGKETRYYVKAEALEEYKNHRDNLPDREAVVFEVETAMEAYAAEITELLRVAEAERIILRQNQETLEKSVRVNNEIMREILEYERDRTARLRGWKILFGVITFCVALIPFLFLLHFLFPSF